jgi:hypothetical protein
MVLFEEQANVIIIGKKRSAKTTLGWLLGLKFAKHDRELFVYKFPKPEMLKKLPFKVTNVTQISQISNLRNAVLLVDEAHRVFPVGEKRVNGQFRDLLSVSGQNNLCVILICHNSYFINRSLFSFIDIKCIKETNEGHWELERPYMKKLYQDILIKGKDKFFIDSDEVKGIQSFKCPSWFTQEFSNCYSVTHAEMEEDFFDEINANPNEKVRNAKVKCEEKCEQNKYCYNDPRRWYSEFDLKKLH